MKQSTTIISVIVAAVVILAAFAIGLYVREIKRKNRPAESEAVVELETKQPEKTTAPSSEDQQSSRNLLPEQRAQLTEQIENIKQQWASMSEAERKEFRAKMVEIFQAGRPERSRSFQTSPPEARDKFAEEFLLIKTKWEDMSEQERQEYWDKMRERFNAIRQGND
jgi:predicted S18 family serine protease